MLELFLRYLLPLLPGVATSVVGLFSKKKDAKIDEKKRAVVEQSTEFHVEPTAQPEQLEIEQVRDLPRHPTLKWKRRSLSDITMIVIHHTATDYTKSTWKGIANYSISPECHLNPGVGAPYIPYHFGVDLTGVSQFNDLEDITWSVLGYNRQSINISVLGNFPTKDDNGKAPNHVQPLHSKLLELLIKDLQSKFPFTKVKTASSLRIKTHKELGKHDCPGDELVEWVSKQVH
jgi:hypothetical protein